MSAARVKLGGDGRITISWDDPIDAREVGYVLQRAGLDDKGRVRDHGFYDDGTAILAAVDEWDERGEERL